MALDSGDAPHLTIAHVLLSLNLGGAERMVVDLATRQAARGHAVTVMVLSAGGDDALRARLTEGGVDVETVPRGQGLDATLVARLARALRRRRPHVVHTHNRTPLIYGAPAGRLIGARVVHTRHGGWVGPPREQVMRRLASAAVNAYVVVTPTLARVVTNLGEVSPSKLRVIDNGVDLERFAFDEGQRQAIRAELGIPGDAVVFGSVGRLVVEKNYPHLIRACAPLLGERCRLLLVGDGDERAGLASLVDAEGLRGKVHLVGARQDVTSLLSAMDVFVLSSTTEGLPLALLEAMANGRAIVSTAVGGIPEIVTQDVTGLLVPSEDVEQMRTSLARLRDAPARAQELGQAARAFALGRYSLDRMVSAYVQLYRQIGADR